MEVRTAYDFSPLYRSVIGADRLATLYEAAAQGAGERAYPPYDIEKTDEDGYRITVAAAGFKPSDLEITTQPNLLIISGRRSESEDNRTYLHRGIAHREFERRFELADHVVVTQARCADGVLSIDLQRQVPEASKPRRISITAGPESNLTRLADRQDARAA
jgi:molecular chaperone IbpA